MLSGSPVSNLQPPVYAELGQQNYFTPLLIGKKGGEERKKEKKRKENGLVLAKAYIFFAS